MRALAAAAVLVLGLGAGTTARAAEGGPGKEEAAKARAEVEALWRTATGWAVGTARSRVLEARRRLAALGAPALAKALSRLGTTRSLEAEAVERVLLLMGAAAAEGLLEALESADGARAVRLGLRVLGKLEEAGRLGAGQRERAERVILGLCSGENLAVRLRALRVAASFGLRSALPLAAALRDHENEEARRGAAQVLGRFGGAEAVPPLLDLLDDRLMTVRYPAQDALAAVGEAAVPALEAALGRHPAARRRHHLLLALGCIAAPGSEKTLLARLDHEDPFTRGFALRALQRMARALCRRYEKGPLAAWNQAPDEAKKEAAAACARHLGDLKARVRSWPGTTGPDETPFVLSQHRLLDKAVREILAREAPE